MTQPHPLDRPVWNTLHDGWASLARGDAHAVRLDTKHGPFGAAADSSAESQRALSRLVPPDGELWIVETSEAPPPPDAVVLRTGALHQMVATGIDPVRADFDVAVLTDDDADEMRALAHLTKPGPFFVKTHRLGKFIGVRQDGRLVAMAGERMRTGAFAEVSGVCTHPDHRGHGYAGALMSIVAERMVARGETPFLHCYAGNAAAIAIYERLGFRLRRPMVLTVLGRQ